MVFEGEAHNTTGRTPLFRTIKCPPSFDFEALLRHSTEAELAALSFERMRECEELGDFVDDASAVSKETNRAQKRRADKSESRGHKRRRRQRDETFAQEGHVVRRNVLDEHVRSAMPIAAPVDLSTFPATNGAYSAKHTNLQSPSMQYSVSDLMAMGFELIQWDGYCNRPFVDDKGRIIAALVGQPKDASYAAAAESAFMAIMKEGKSAAFLAKEVNHPRGGFPAVNVGVTHGNGTEAPVYLNNRRHTKMVDLLLGNADIQRLASFASASFAMWAPNVYGHYRERLNKLFDHEPHLRRIFRKSIYPAAAFNFGPNVWTFKHKDVLNCPFGWCAIQALGDFNPKMGGHLVLWDLKIVVEFPAGSLILIPSATLTHSNIPVAEGDTRASFTQYCAGGLFRYVEYGFCRESELKKKDSKTYAELWKLRPHKWEAGLALLSTLEDFQ